MNLNILLRLDLDFSDSDNHLKNKVNRTLTFGSMRTFLEVKKV